MVLRIASALILVPLALSLVIYAPPPILLTVLGILGTLCLSEYFRLVEKMGLVGHPRFGYLSLWTLLIALRYELLPAPALLFVFLIACFIAALWTAGGFRERLTSVMVNLLGVLYLSLSLYCALPLRYDFGRRPGLAWTLFLLAVIWSGDMAALMFGKLFGRSPLSPGISPKKTNEGAIAGLLSGIAAGLLLQRFFFPELPGKHLVVLALLLGIAGQLGDLAESILKRAADVKDSSNLIPGHGGVLDRLDSLLFATPVLYACLWILYRP